MSSEIPWWESAGLMNISPEDNISFALNGIYSRYNKLQESMDREEHKRFLGPSDHLELGTGQNGNQLIVQTIDKFGNELSSFGIQIGSFSAKEGNYLLFPEYFEDRPEDAKIIQSAARDKREVFIEKFDTDPTIISYGTTRTEYKHPLIKELHGMHYDYFRLRGCLDDILDGHNRQNMDAPEVRADEDTQAAVYLGKTLVGDNKYDYNEIGVRVIGAFNRINEINFRIPGLPLMIDVARRDFINGVPGEYEQINKYLNFYEFDEFIDQTEPVKELDRQKDLGGEFLCRHLGINMKPKNPNNI